MINAAFATEGVKSLELSGLWRPEYKTFSRYFMESTAFGNASAGDRQDKMTKAMAAAHIPPNWTNTHVRGDGLDIQKVNSYAINNKSGNVAQPELVRQFSYNLANGASAVIQPWMTYNLYPESAQRIDMGAGFVKNLGVRYGTKLEAGHLNHLHVTY